jgi:hypothetical protein
MALLTISGDPASRWDEIARSAAALLEFELVTEARLEQWIAEEFGEAAIPARVWRAAALLVLSRHATNHHLVIAADGAEYLFEAMPFAFRIRIAAANDQRAGNIMIDERLEKPQAQDRLRALDAGAKKLRRARFARSTHVGDSHDLTIHMAQLSPEQAAEIAVAAAGARSLPQFGMLSAATANEIQFEARLKLAKFGIAPAGRASAMRTLFGHPSEQMFANLLDFYRIEWAYEPRSFPLQWDKDGNVTEAFTPDFYLPESDLYIELTTMKQSLVTRKNRKVKLLRAIYPHVNIQVFYQKDFQDLVFKYGWKAS